jgi:hypothetical protein
MSRERLAARAHHAQGTPAAVAALVGFERDEFADARSHAVVREGRDVDENFLAASPRLDEAEAAFIVPFDLFAVGAHDRTSGSRDGTWPVA